MKISRIPVSCLWSVTDLISSKGLNQQTAAGGFLRSGRYMRGTFSVPRFFYARCNAWHPVLPGLCFFIFEKMKIFSCQLLINRGQCSVTEKRNNHLVLYAKKLREGKIRFGSLKVR